MLDPELASETKTKLRRQSKRKCEQLARSLSAYRFRGPLGEVMRAFQLQPEHFQILAILLDRQMRAEEPAVEGRLILAAIFQTPFEILSRLNLLHPSSPLRAAGLIRVEDDDSPDDVLEARFCLSGEAVEAFRGEVAGLVPQDLHQRRTFYTHHREFLVDLRILHNLHKHRSAKIFNQDRWDRLHVGGKAFGEALTKRIETLWRKIQARLENSSKADTFPAARFLRKHALGSEEMVMVVHLLFRELYEGNPYVDVVELLRLVSAHEEDLIKNRGLVHPTAPLLRHEILVVEPILDGRTLTGEAYLAGWVVNAVLGVPVRDEAIAADERIDWHLYLDGIDGTKGFYKDLESN